MWFKLKRKWVNDKGALAGLTLCRVSIYLFLFWLNVIVVDDAVIVNWMQTHHEGSVIFKLFYWHIN